MHSKTFLGVVTAFAIVMLAFPYYSSMLYPKTEKQIIIVNNSNIKTTEYKISGMTCASCEAHVNHEVNKLNGIVNSKTSYENGNSIIEFDETKTNELEIEKAINATGYKVTDKKRKLMQTILKSEITCPNCGHKKVEDMPTNACQFFYECEHCKTV